MIFTIFILLTCAILFICGCNVWPPQQRVSLVGRPWGERKWS